MSQRVSPFQPTTFLERGVFVPFTTPMLAGARVRPADRCGLELIVPNPSGGRGDYILPWTALRSLCRPTVHDATLTERIGMLPSVSPATIRQVAWQIASEGLAGRAAGLAASAAQGAEEQGRLVTNFFLLLQLVQQAEPAGLGAVPPEQEAPAQLELRARRTIAALAPRLRQDAETIASTLEALAGLYTPIGLGDRVNRARLPHAIARVRLLRREVATLRPEAGDAAGELAEMVVRTADATLSLVGPAVQAARDSARHVVKLLVDWQADAKGVGRRLARPEWLLDGWDRIGRLWSLARDDAGRRECLDEIVALLPVIPKEAGEWVGFVLEAERPPRTQRFVSRHEDWRTGHCVEDTVARNEALLAA